MGPDTLTAETGPPGKVHRVSAFEVGQRANRNNAGIYRWPDSLSIRFRPLEAFHPHKLSENSPTWIVVPKADMGHHGLCVRLDVDLSHRSMDSVLVRSLLRAMNSSEQ